MVNIGGINPNLGPCGGNPTLKRQGHGSRALEQISGPIEVEIVREGMSGGSHRCIIVLNESEAP